MLRFYYNPRYKYTNREIINLLGDDNFVEKDYQNIDSPDTINGHIIYKLSRGESIPSYIFDTENNRRYFVSGITQLRSGKFQISLLRDIISESPSTWSQEDAYISAGTATDYNKYKRWNLPFTNTKIKEERLNINGKSSFFVYYVNTQSFEGDVVSETDLKIKSTSIPGITGFDYEVDNLNEIPSFRYVNAGKVYKVGNSSMHINISFRSGNYERAKYNWSYYKNNNEDSFSFSGQYSSTPFSGALVLDKTRGSDFQQNQNNCRTQTKSKVSSFIDGYVQRNYQQISASEVNNLSPYVGKIIYNRADSKAYRITLAQSNYTSNTNMTSSEQSILFNAINQISFPVDFNSGNSNSYSGGWALLQLSLSEYSYTLEELGVATGFDFNFKSDTRKLPKSAVRCVNIVSGEGFEDDDIAQALMLAQTNGINEQGDTGRILDIQFLPFSVATKTNSNFKLNQTNLIAQFLDSDDFEYDIDLPDLTNINKETDTIKIVSPSRASQYLFRPYDNDGSMIFNAKITIKPYASVIYIRPSTKGLLMYDWNDKDCLIINEDFSLTNVSSAWTNYIYNNRNYQNAFEREIQGREFERSWERRIEQAQARSDEWTARNISADKARTYTANLPLISDIAGAIGTAFQDQTYMQMAQLDREYNESLYQEGLSISRDLFNMQLDNIKSQPLIPSRVTTIDIKFLDGVYLEFYSTNYTELMAIESYYKYNGNRVDDYGVFQTYWGHFVRGKIIKSNNYTQPEIDELNRRLGMGIFTEVNYGN